LLLPFQILLLDFYSVNTTNVVFSVCNLNNLWIQWWFILFPPGTYGWSWGWTIYLF